jgi:hypothetical protein
MPAPKVLAGLPKPLLFGLYGAVGGLVGALVFGELIWRGLKPPEASLPVPEPRIAVAAAKELELFVEGRNPLPVQVARGDFEGAVNVRIEGLPPEVAAAPIVIPAEQSAGELQFIGGRNAGVGNRTLKLIAEATANGKTAVADTSLMLKVTNPPRPEADIVFVLDVTSSMQWAIDDLKNGIGRFADTLAKARIDYRLALVTFRDITVPGERIDIITFKDNDPFTAEGDDFREAAGKLRASGGGDIPESSLEALVEATKLPLRKSATKVFLLITDAPAKASGTTMPATIKALQDAKIDSVRLVIQKYDVEEYSPLMTVGGNRADVRHFDLGDVVRGDEGFDPILDSFGTVVTEAARAKVPDSKPQVATRAEPPVLTVKSLQSSERSAAGTEGRVILRSGVWAGAIAAMVCFTLLAGQHHYLRGTLPSFRGVIAGLVGGMFVGLVGGAAGQWLYLYAPGGSVLGTIFQVLGWTLLGGLAGAGLSPFIPNLRWSLGLAGGAIGGAAGAAGYLAALSVGEVVGRLVGGGLLGFCIGLMVAVVEAAFRRAWLEVRFGKRETITVNLGPEPVKIGGDSGACTVWARGAAPVALRFFVRDGAVICDDPVMKRESQATDGFVKEVGNVTVTVRTAATAAAPRPQAAATPKPQPSAPARPIPLDDEEDLLPMPLPSASPPPPPAPPKIAPAPLIPPKPPAPVARPTAKPPIPTAPPPVVPAAVPKTEPEPAPAVAKHPDACPDCGRVNPGKPKQRYCMVCDNTY